MFLKRSGRFLVGIVALILSCGNPSGPKELDRRVLMGEWESDTITRDVDGLISTFRYYTKCTIEARDISFKLIRYDSVVIVENGELRNFYETPKEFIEWRVYENEIVCSSYVHPGGKKDYTKWTLEYRLNNEKNEMWVYNPWYVEDSKYVYSWFKYKKVKQ